MQWKYWRGVDIIVITGAWRICLPFSFSFSPGPRLDDKICTQTTNRQTGLVDKGPGGARGCIHSCIALRTLERLIPPGIRVTFAFSFFFFVLFFSGVLAGGKTIACTRGWTRLDKAGTRLLSSSSGGGARRLIFRTLKDTTPLPPIGLKCLRSR